jgi:chemotaxis protein CheC
MNEQILSPLQEDYLKEIINVSFGLAASIIGDMLGTKAELMIPKVGIFPISKLGEVVKARMEEKSEMLLIKQFFQSTVNGDAYFMLSKSDAVKLASMLFKKEDISSQEIDCVATELTNILTSACIGQIAQMSNSKTIFLPPEVINEQRLLEIGSGDLKGFTQFMIVETKLNLEKQGIAGEMLILIGEGVLSIILSGIPSNV